MNRVTDFTDRLNAGGMNAASFTATGDNSYCEGVLTDTAGLC